MSLPKSSCNSSVSSQATLLDGAYGPPLGFNVCFESGASWRVQVRNDGEGPVIVGAEPSDGLVPLGGLSAFPQAVAQAAIEAEMRRRWDSMRAVFRAAGFRDPPPPRNARSGRKPGRKPQPHATLAVRAQHAIKSGNLAVNEKVLSKARGAGLLHGRPRPHEFTDLGLGLLAECDRASEQVAQILKERGGIVGLETFGPELVPPFPVAVVNAAIEQLVLDRRVRVMRHAPASARRIHRFEALELTLR